MNNYGNAQRRYGAEAPALYEKATRKVCMDVQPCQYTDHEGGTVDGYSWIEMYLGEGSMDYGAVKSKLIEYAYPQKDEFGMLMNAVAVLIAQLPEEASEHEDIAKFNRMNHWRDICAETAKAVCRQIGTIV